MSDEELANELGLKPRTLKTLRLQKLVPCVKLGEKTIRYRRSAVEAALAKMEVKAISVGKTAALLIAALVLLAIPALADQRNHIYPGAVDQPIQH